MIGRTNCGSGGGAYAVITVTTTDFIGQSVTCTNNGTYTKTKTFDSDGKATFKITIIGEYTISHGDYSTSVEVTAIGSEYFAELSEMPDGSTATPTDVVQTWLKCASISKSYTTISQVLADSTTLLALISDENACNYMVRSTTWASSVCANSTAMTDIGNNSICADLLLSNSTWLNAICNSTYFENVLNTKVPTMTSDTTPSGMCFGGARFSATYAVYRAFDNDNSSCWLAPDSISSSNAYIGYQFANPVCIKKVYVINVPSSWYAYAIGGYTVQASNDASTWVTLGSGTISQSGGDVSTLIINNTNKYSHYRILCTLGNYSKAGCATLQFYGRI